MNKIAFTTSGNDLKAELDPRFGRAQFFLVYDLQQNSIQIIDNKQSRSAAQGAGIQAAEIVARAGVDALVTGHCGPKAFKALSAAGVAVYNCDAMTIEDALEALKSGSLQQASSADVEGHW